MTCWEKKSRYGIRSNEFELFYVDYEKIEILAVEGECPLGSFWRLITWCLTKNLNFTGKFDFWVTNFQNQLCVRLPPVESGYYFWCTRKILDLNCVQVCPRWKTSPGPLLSISIRKFLFPYCTTTSPIAIAIGQQNCWMVVSNYLGSALHDRWHNGIIFYSRYVRTLPVTVQSLVIKSKMCQLVESVSFVIFSNCTCFWYLFL